MKKYYKSASDLVKHMEWHVKRTVKHYQSDFYKYDISRLHEIENAAEKGNYLWIIRDCGTHIVKVYEDEPIKKNVYYEAILQNYGSNMKTFTFTYNGNAFTFEKGMHA